jgi:hypothetical protein
MPQNITIAAFVFGAVLLLIALLGGGFKIFGAEVSGNTGRGQRVVAGIAGIVLIIVGLVGSLNKAPASQTPAAPSSLQPLPQAGLTVMVHPSVVQMNANGQATVTWTLAETNNVGINVTDRTGEWRTTADKLVKTVGPIRTTWRIDPLGRMEWKNDIVLYEDSANEAVDGYLVLDQGFHGQDDNHNSVIGKARVRVKVSQ